MNCCFECRFFVLDGKAHPDQTRESDWQDGTCEGTCRRRSPQLGPIIPQQNDHYWRAYAEWPKVLGTDWCGHFKDRLSQGE